MDRIPLVDEVWTAKDGSGQTLTVRYVSADNAWCAGTLIDGTPRVVTVLLLNRAFLPPDPLRDITPPRVFVNLYPTGSAATVADRRRSVLTKDNADAAALADRVALLRYVHDGTIPAQGQVSGPSSQGTKA